MPAHELEVARGERVGLAEAVVRRAVVRKERSFILRMVQLALLLVLLMLFIRLLLWLCDFIFVLWRDLVLYIYTF